MVDFITVYGCILVENNVDEDSRLLLATEMRLKFFSKLYCLCIKYCHSEHIFSGPGGHGPFGPPRSTSIMKKSNAKHHMSLPKWVMSKVGWGKL